MTLRYLLDTDHLTLLQRAHPGLRRRMESMDLSQIAISVISVEEQMQGWLGAIRKASQSRQDQGSRLSLTYGNLRSSVQFLAQFQILDYSEAAHDRVLGWRQQGVRVGTQDLRIAAVALD